jgi:hypothetical protein
MEQRTVTLPTIVRRVLARSALGVWRHRLGLGLAALISAGLGGYLYLGGGQIGAPGLGGRSAAAAQGDCADITMTAIAEKAPDVAQQAYQCLAPTFRQQVTEQQFVQQIQGRSGPIADKMARVGAYDAPNGQSMVYYALNIGGQSVGYIVYLNPTGEVLKIE